MTNLPSDPPGSPSGFPERIIPDIEALLEYALAQGLDPEGRITSPLAAALERKRSGTDPEQDGGWPGELIPLYAQLSQLALDKGVTGFSIRDSREVNRHIRGLCAGGFLLFLLAALTEMLLRAGHGTAQGEWHLVLAGLSVPMGILEYLNPIFWGGLGACVYLLKTISDRASDFTFDSRRLRGLPARVLLGAVFGALLVNALDLQIDSLAASAMAFVGGLGVRALYAAFEALIDGIHDRITSTTPVTGPKRQEGG
jgi:hypothetical protein